MVWFRNSSPLLLGCQRSLQMKNPQSQVEPAKPLVLSPIFLQFREIWDHFSSSLKGFVDFKQVVSKVNNDFTVATTVCTLREYISMRIKNSQSRSNEDWFSRSSWTKLFLKKSFGCCNNEIKLKYYLFCSMKDKNAWLRQVRTANHKSFLYVILFC